MGIWAVEKKPSTVEIDGHKIFAQCFGGIIKSDSESHTYIDECIQFSRATSKLREGDETSRSLLVKTRPNT